MKQKILGFLLMGAFAIASTSTFVSCKDYDDDISGLQTKINDLTTLVNSKESTIKTSVSTLESALSTLETSVTGKLETGDAATLAAAKQAIADAKSTLESSIANNASSIEANANGIAALTTANATQDIAITAAQTSADQALAQLEQLIAAFTATSRGGNATQSLEGVQAAVASITQMKADLADLNAKYNTLSDQMVKVVSDLAELQTAVNGQQAALEALAGESGDITQIAANIASLVNRINALERQIGEQGEDSDNSLAEQIAALSEEVEALSNKIDETNPEANTIAVALAKALRSLVFQPSLYVDGIESIEYPYIHDTLIVQDASSRTINRPARTTAGFVDAGKQIVEANGNNAAKLAKLRDWNHRRTVLANDIQSFGPSWPVSYHMNPSKSTVAWEDVAGWNVRQADVITRSDAANTFKVDNVYSDGTELFSTANGIVTVGLKIGSPNLLAHHASPTEAQNRPGTLHEDGTNKTNGLNFDDIIALQVTSEDGDEDTKLVTSDYAMIYPEEVWPEAIIWNKKPNKLNTTTINFDEKCPYDGVVHVWDDPYEALGANDASVYPDIELQWDDENGIRLGDYLGIHFIRDCKTRERKVPGTWAYGEEAKWGYHYEFRRVGYSIDNNITIDSNYALFKDEDENGISKEGVIEAWNVNADGTTLKEKSQSSVGREPLVQVMVKDSKGREILDAYILIHITRYVKPDETTKETVDFSGEHNFDLCNDGTLLTTTWSQFSNLILTNKLNNMTKDEFDETYGCTISGNVFAGVPDLNSDANQPVPGAGDAIVYTDVKIYKNENGTPVAAADHAGTVRYTVNNNATTNHTFTWVMSAEDLEFHTHDKAELPVTKTFYIRYTKRNASSRPDYVYVKLEGKIGRELNKVSGITEKNINYWFSTASATMGADDGFDAIFFNPQFPADGGLSFQAPTTGLQNVFNNDIYNTFAQNRVNFTNNYFSSYNGLAYNNVARNEKAKFYFAPVNTEITAQDGTTYVITARSGNRDEKWDAFVCKYNVDEIPAGKTKYQVHKWSNDAAKNQETLNKCAINYNDGVFTNDKLYAVAKSAYNTQTSYTEIATLDQDIITGHVELIYRAPDDDITKEVLNAIGYKNNHENVLEELHTMVGVVAKNDCDVAIYVTEYAADADNKNAGTFWTSWNRPINVDTNESGLQDAKNNGDYIHLVDMMKLYDWRGPVAGYMYDNQQWLWAYYNVKSVTIDVTPSKVMTNMNQTDPTVFKKLSDVTTRARLYAFVPSATPGQKYDYSMTASIDFTAQIAGYPTVFNAADKNADLLRELGIQPVDEALKDKFGGLYYENNGEHVETFDLIVPVQVNYGWGRFVSEIRVKVNRTLGH